jgi:hypothetical protein
MRSDYFPNQNIKSAIDKVKLKDGKLLNYYSGLNPDDLTDPVKEELSQLPASQLDILYIRKNIHAHGNTLQSISGNVEMIQKDIEKINESMDKALYVEIINGKTTKRLISDVIAEIYQRESLRRDISKILQTTGRHKTVIYGFLIVLIVINLFFGAEIKLLLDLAKEHLWNWATSIFGGKQ